MGITSTSKVCLLLNNPGDSYSADMTLPTQQKDDLENAPLAEIEVVLEKARQDEICLRKLQELQN